ncbi:MAG: MarR family transcriptional regulator, partial [Clostridiaceae bacterium]|nr:MarR family transcriptional regulator [Clostridiaceae bacterium]
SLGTDGALFADGSALVLGRPAGIVHDGNATGAGDAMAAAFAWSANEAFSLEDIARYGVAAATLAVESDEAVNPALSYDLLLQRSEKVKIEVIK